MRLFVRQSMKRGRCNAFNQHYKSEVSDEGFDIILKKLNVNVNICNLLEKYFKFLKKMRKNMPKNSIQNMMKIEILI